MKHIWKKRRTFVKEIRHFSYHRIKISSLKQNRGKILLKFCLAAIQSARFSAYLRSPNRSFVNNMEEGWSIRTFQFISQWYRKRYKIRLHNYSECIFYNNGREAVCDCNQKVLNFSWYSRCAMEGQIYSSLAILVSLPHTTPFNSYLISNNRF